MLVYIHDGLVTPQIFGYFDAIQFPVEISDSIMSVVRVSSAWGAEHDVYAQYPFAHKQQSDVIYDTWPL